MGVCLCLAFAFFAAGQNYRAAVAKTVITPVLPFPLTGYGGRTKPAEEKVHDLWAKALVIESGKEKLAIITTDVLGLTPAIENNICEQLHKKYGFKKSQILLNASHTHSGPMVWPSLEMIGDYDSTQIRQFLAYNSVLTNKIVEITGQAFNSLQPVQISTGNGSAGFAKNRRQHTEKGVVNGINPNGPVDHQVPVLKVASGKKTMAIVFGYACHNTTVTGSNYLINGDYSGFAQLELEKIYPGSTTLFLTGCAGDQNPQPRGTLELAAQHGKTLAASVRKVMNGKMNSVKGPVKTSVKNVDLKFRPYSEEYYVNDLNGTNAYKQRRARFMLQAEAQGWNISNYTYPVQAVRLGNALTIVALAGEVVVDYALNTKNKYPRENIFVSGYCNHVMCYIPTKKILQEGGYEAEDNLIYYAKPGPFEEDVEQKIMTTIGNVLHAVGVEK